MINIGTRIARFSPSDGVIVRVIAAARGSGLGAPTLSSGPAPADVLIDEGAAMARLVVGIATVMGLGAAALAAATTGAMREGAVITSLYGAFVVVVAGGPRTLRWPALRPIPVRVHRRVR